LTSPLLTFEISLASINFGLMCVGATQVARITLYNQSLKKGGIKEAAKEEVQLTEDLAKDTATAAKKAVNA
jgi:hypothetical protein